MATSPEEFKVGDENDAKRAFGASTVGNMLEGPGPEIGSVVTCGVVSAPPVVC